jgi:tetratricopeptide (TPR) repeat protein
MRRRTAGPSLVLALFVSLGSPARAGETSLPDPGDRWIKVRTAHFTLFSDATEIRTLEIGANLERFRAVLARTVSGLEVNSPVPTWIYVFKDDAAFRPYKKRVGTRPANVSGAFAAHRDGNYVAIDAFPPTDPWVVVYHEYMHYFLNNNFEDIPLWFNEGMAEAYSTFTTDAHEVEIGRPIDAHLRLLRSGFWIPLDVVFAITPDSKDYNEGERQGIFYAESWALAHYLAWGGGDAGTSGVGFLAEFKPRADLRVALKTLLGDDQEALKAKVFEYLRRRKFAYSVVDLKDLKIEPPSEPEPMTRAETLARLGDYLLHSQMGREKDAEAHFQEAIRADPNLAAAYTGMGYLRDLQKRRDDAAAAYEKALSLAPADPLTMFLYAESLMDRYVPTGMITRRTTGGATPPELARARDLYRASIRLRPDVAEAYAGLGATFTLDDDNLSEGIQALEKARRMLPSRMDVALNLAGLYARSGDVSQAKWIVEGALAISGDRAMLEAGREILLETDLKRAESLINKGDVDAGVAVLEDIRSRTQSADLRRDLDGQIARLEDTRTLNRQIATYNSAVALANKGSYTKAAALLEALLPEVKDPKLQGDAQALLKRLRKTTASQPNR